MVSSRSGRGLRWWMRVGLASLSLALTACTLQVTTLINADGSGEYRTEIGFSPAEEQSLTATSGSVDTFCQASASAALPLEGTATVGERDGQTWCVVTVPFADLQELRRLYESNAGLTVHRLEIVNGHTYYDITLGNESSNANSANGFAALGGLMAQAIDVSWRVSLPGRVGSNNGDTVQSNTVTWQLDVKASSQRLTAESQPAWWPAWFPAVLIVAGGLTVGVAFYGWSRTRRRRRPAIEASWSGTPGAAPPTLYCPNCGHALTSVAQFCPECGARRPIP